MDLPWSSPRLITAVATGKQRSILKKSREEDAYIALLAYRNTRQQGHINSPAQRLMSRRPRELIPMATSKLQQQLTVPCVVTQNIAVRKQKAKARYDKQASKQLREFAIGESGGAEQVEQPEFVNPEHHASQEIVLRRSSRNWKLPSRFKDYVMKIS